MLVYNNKFKMTFIYKAAIIVLVADTKLYERLHPTFYWSIGLLVCP